jgi:hypothetical protein
VAVSTAIELIQIVESAGGRFVVDGDRLGIFPKDAAVSVLDELRQHKQAILDLLSRRPQMPAGVRLVWWEPKDAPVRLSECSTVTDTDKFIRSTLIQLDNQLQGRTWMAGNWGLSGLLARLEACGCHVTLDDARKALQ